MSPLPKSLKLAPEVSKALQAGTPVVALESAVITHGLPYPQNQELAKDLEAEVRAQGATPATIAVVDGRICIGLEQNQVESLAQGEGLRKVSLRDFSTAIAQGASGGTTVAGTLLAAEKVGIKVFATGGIGGVHRETQFDVSPDIQQLACSPLIVVCSGAKAILDLPATLEALETMGVPVIGYQTDEFPAFYSPDSGLPVSARVNSPEELVEIAYAHWGLGFKSALLVTVPPPGDSAVPYKKVAGYIDQAIEEANTRGIHGQGVTPFLLSRVSELSGGLSLKANLALLKNNARVAAEIARLVYRRKDIGRV